MLVTLVTVVVALIFVGIKIVLKLTTGRCNSSVCLIGKTALITGGNYGIGYETALQLAARGCRVIIASRNSCDETKSNIIKKTNNKNIITKQFDLASLTSVRNLAQDIIKNEERLDILINNSGAIGLDFSYTEDDLLLGMQVNHFGSFLLTHLLIDLLKKSSPSRIIFVSSHAAYFSNLKAEELNFPPTGNILLSAKFMDYCNTKLCGIISARGFANKLKGTGVTSNSLNPGSVSTPIADNYIKSILKSDMKITIWNIISKAFKWFLKSPSEGAQTTVHLAVATEVENITGKYFSDCKIFFTPWQAKNNNFSDQIWKLSEKFAKLSDNEKL